MVTNGNFGQKLYLYMIFKFNFTLSKLKIKLTKKWVKTEHPNSAAGIPTWIFLYIPDFEWSRGFWNGEKIYKIQKKNINFVFGGNRKWPKPCIFRSNVVPICLPELKTNRFFKNRFAELIPTDYRNNYIYWPQKRVHSSFTQDRVRRNFVVDENFIQFFYFWPNEQSVTK